MNFLETVNSISCITMQQYWEAELQTKGNRLDVTSLSVVSKIMFHIWNECKTSAFDGPSVSRTRGRH